MSYLAVQKCHEVGPTGTSSFIFCFPRSPNLLVLPLSGYLFFVWSTTICGPRQKVTDVVAKAFFVLLPSPSFPLIYVQQQAGRDGAEQDVLKPTRTATATLDGTEGYCLFRVN